VQKIFSVKSKYKIYVKIFPEGSYNHPTYRQSFPKITLEQIKIEVINYV